MKLACQKYYGKIESLDFERHIILELKVDEAHIVKVK